MSTTKLNARDVFIAHVLATGWVADTTHTVTSHGYASGRARAEAVEKQHSFSYTRPAAHGGRWRIVLNYRVSGGGWSNDRVGTTLRGIRVSYIATEDRNSNGNLTVTPIGDLRQESKYGSTVWLARVLDYPTLRKQSEVFVANPDLVIWLALEAQHKDKVYQEAQWKAHRIDREARDQPIQGITVSQTHTAEGGNEWQRLTDALRDAAQAVTQADGKTHLPSAIDALRAAVDAVDAVVERP